jgi:hypothetical protein
MSEGIEKPTKKKLVYRFIVRCFPWINAMVCAHYLGPLETALIATTVISFHIYISVD